MSDKTFRGRKIFEDNGYPAVYWPKHPLAKSNRIAYIHRIIAYEHYGDEVKNAIVRHKDKDVYNWDIDNLVVEERSKFYSQFDWPDQDEVITLVRALGKKGAAERLGCSRRSIYRYLKRHDINI